MCQSRLAAIIELAHLALAMRCDDIVGKLQDEPDAWNVKGLKSRSEDGCGIFLTEQVSSPDAPGRIEGT